MTDSDDTSATDETQDADTFGVGIHVTDTELRFVVNVPSDIDSGWTNPEAFQQLVERITWDILDQQDVLSTIASKAPDGETVFLGTVTLRPDETLVDHTLRTPSFETA
ncbi:MULTISPECIES: hypothetical protein [Haloferax]|uniref:DUF8124 domain-containing protein n=2 Tax=Haloferax TaxID=2251 RepID=A0A6G1Z314_9EURY|nr:MULTISPECIES: hypothetical protein [Haloferax]KAB1188253.1 hypothetical protein Hfx1149_09500 [Haloferax sp. CBA1149]MRW80936.1 hypothetical protein [Haloferax marinisediminis]